MNAADLNSNSLVIWQKGKSQKRVLQEDKARQIFRKNDHFLPSDMHTTWVWNVRFSENLACFVFL